MRALIGIGNPGVKYEGTRHNIGFDVIDALAKRMRVDVSKREHGSEVGVTSVRGERVVLLKPQVYVNLSGQAVRSLMKGGLRGEDLLVIVDDLNLPVGQIRVRPNGGDGGHNGLKSIIEVVGNGQFPRLRIGIGAPAHGEDASDHVLSEFRDDEAEVVKRAVEMSAGALAVWLRRNDLNMMMNQLNRAHVETLESRDSKATAGEERSSFPETPLPDEGREEARARDMEEEDV